MNQSYKQMVLKAKNDLLWYSENFLKIRTKNNGVIPLSFNKEQLLLHNFLEEQKKNNGMVRALVLKSRQIGLSTYIAARAFHNICFNEGKKSFVLSHRQDATNNVGSMLNRFYNNLPSIMQPLSNKNNNGELYFSKLDSGFKLATAGGSQTGRGETIQFFHGSEVAFWNNDEEHLMGALNSVADSTGSEIILESTANGNKGSFYKLCMAALDNNSEFKLYFIPWFWHNDYKSLPTKTSFSKVWQDYSKLHNLTLEQLNWAYKKSAFFAKSMGENPDETVSWRFKQEFPAIIADAFHSTNTNTLITPSMLFNKDNGINENNHVILGVDVARGGGDLSYIIDRTGNKLGFIVNEKKNIANSMELVDWIANHINKTNAKAVYIDSGGNGAAIYDRLREVGFSNVVRLINFGGKANDTRKYANKRAEMWGELKIWLENGVVVNDNLLHQHLCAPMYSYNSNGQLLLEPKDSIRKRLHFSTDGGDAAALTFALTNKTEIKFIQNEQDYNPINY